MLRKFMEDVYLYNTIKDVTGFTEDHKIEFIFDKLYNQFWSIMDIERLKNEAEYGKKEN